MLVTDTGGFVEYCWNHENEEWEERRNVIVWKILILTLAYMASLAIVVMALHHIFVSHKGGVS